MRFKFFKFEKINTRLLAVFLALFLYFIFGLSNITRYITADEHFWLPSYGSERISEYWRAIADRNWKATRINDKPGVTLAYVSGLALPFASDLIDQQIVFSDGTVKIFNPAVTEKINFLFRFPLLVFNGIFIFYFFWIIKKITGREWVAAWSAILILLSPTLLGISQIVNPDTLFWSLGTASFLTFFAYLRFRKQKYVWLTGIFLGLSLLSKYVSVIFFPFFILMIFWDYLFLFEKEKDNLIDFSSLVKKDVRNYLLIVILSLTIFAVLMPAIIVDGIKFLQTANWKEIFFPQELSTKKSDFGFIIAQKMKLFFLIIITLLAMVWAEAKFLKSVFLSACLSFLSRYLRYWEKIIYFLFLAVVLFVFFNWVLKNSLYDLSGISFDSKTKASFTTDNSYGDRFIVEWVPLVFSLTPVAFFLLVLAWTQAFFGAIIHRRLFLAFSSFFLVFYIAVIEQGLLVTARYSIILFPLTFILGSLAIHNLLFAAKEKKEEKKRSLIFSFGFLFLFVIVFTLVSVQENISVENQNKLDIFIGNYFFFLAITAVLISFLAARLIINKTKILFFLKGKEIVNILISLLLIVFSLFSLKAIYPHYFVYVNGFLPERYLLSNPWGYGGYEAAQYLNQKPNARELIIWTDAHGICEFFVGRCIHKSKVKTKKYPIDYIVRTFHGQISPEFLYDTVSLEWSYAIGGREKNYVRIFKNNPAYGSDFDF